MRFVKDGGNIRIANVFHDPEVLVAEEFAVMVRGYVTGIDVRHVDRPFLVGTAERDGEILSGSTVHGTDGGPLYRVGRGVQRGMIASPSRGVRQRRSSLETEPLTNHGKPESRT